MINFIFIILINQSMFQQSEIIFVNEERKEVFPLDLTLTDEEIIKWLKKRVIPKNKAFVDEILKTLGQIGRAHV